jgi:hypothetical protein
MTQGNPIDLGEHVPFRKLVTQVELHNDSKYPQVLERLEDG